MSLTISSAKDLAQTGQAVLTIVAIVAGLFWFLARRRHAAKANIQHVISHGLLDGRRLWIRSKILVQNCGEVAISITRVQINIYQVSPDLTNAIIWKGPYKDRKMSTATWHELDYLIEEIAFGEKIIDPRETDEITLDSIVPCGAEIISINTHLDAKRYPFYYIKNVDFSASNKEESEMGWTTTTTYNIMKGELR